VGSMALPPGAKLVGSAPPALKLPPGATLVQAAPKDALDAVAENLNRPMTWADRMKFLTGLAASPVTGLLNAPAEVWNFIKHGAHNPPSGGFMGEPDPATQMVNAAQMAVAPAAMEAVKGAAGAVKGAAGTVADAARSPLAADLVGVVSPRAAAALKLANRGLTVAEKLKAVVAERNAPAPEPPAATGGPLRPPMEPPNPAPPDIPQLTQAGPSAGPVRPPMGPATPPPAAPVEAAPAAAAPAAPAAPASPRAPATPDLQLKPGEVVYTGDQPAVLRYPRAAQYASELAAELQKSPLEEAAAPGQAARQEFIDTAKAGGETKYAANSKAMATRFVDAFRQRGVSSDQVDNMTEGYVSGKQIEAGMTPRWGNVAEHLGEKVPSARTIKEIQRQMREAPAQP
jgi:hypothetical protein